MRPWKQIHQVLRPKVDAGGVLYPRAGQLEDEPELLWAGCSWWDTRSCCSLLSFWDHSRNLKFPVNLAQFPNRILTNVASVRSWSSSHPPTIKPLVRYQKHRVQPLKFSESSGNHKRRNLLEDNPILYHISELNTLPHPCDPPRGMEKVTSYLPMEYRNTLFIQIIYLFRQ